jgi:guanylate kinase
VVTATTRAPRAGERDGIDYVFLPDAAFDRWVAGGKFLEWANVHGRRYGTPREQAEAILARGRHALLNIDVQGAAAVRGCGLPCRLVFLLPPSREELVRRLRGRDSDPPEEIARRLRTADEELARQDEFDLKVVNHDARRAADEIARSVSE